MKCLHAQVGDELTRGSNPVGRQARWGDRGDRQREYWGGCGVVGFELWNMKQLYRKRTSMVKGTIGLFSPNSLAPSLL